MRLHLHGEDRELQRFADAVGTGAWTVAKDAKGRWFAASPALSSSPDAGAAARLAGDWLRRVCNAAEILWQRRPRVEAGAIVSEDASGGEIHNISGEARAALGRLEAYGVGTVTNPDGTTVSPTNPITLQRRAEVLEHEPELARAVAFCTRGGWSNLYKACEILAHHGRVVNESEESAFGVSANRPEISGDDARHAIRMMTKPPKKTMTIDEATAFISGMLNDWIAELA